MQAISTIIKKAVLGVSDLSRKNGNEEKLFQYQQLLRICVDELLEIGMTREEISRMINNCLS